MGFVLFIVLFVIPWRLQVLSIFAILFFLWHAHHQTQGLGGVLRRSGLLGKRQGNQLGSVRLELGARGLARLLRGQSDRGWFRCCCFGRFIW